MPKTPILLVFTSLYLAACAPKPVSEPATSSGPAPAGESASAVTAPAPTPEEIAAKENHLRNPRMLTNGGENAEGYWSFDGTKIIFQFHDPAGPHPCDQIYTMNADGTDVKLVSEGKGVCTCAYWFPDGSRLLYASTRHGGDPCPPKPDRAKGYVWSLYPDYELYTAKPDGTDLERLTDSPGYDAEATISKDGRIVFTSMRDGDLDLYSMNLDGSDLKRLTTELGYDGGAFFSADGTKIVYRAYHPRSPEQVAEYKQLLAEGMIKPMALQVMVMNADGSEKKQLTSNEGANFCPFFFPDGKRILFASNMQDPKAHAFDLYAINVDGTGLEQITFDPTFDAFPMFSPDGTKLVWGSNRQGATPRDTNLWIADWVD